MANSRNDKYREQFKRISKIKIDTGLNQKEKANLYYDYVKKLVDMKLTSGMSDYFPRVVQKVDVDEVNKITSLYFSPNQVEQIQVEVQLENEFQNSRVKAFKEQQDNKREAEQIKEYQDIAKLGITPKEINPFSEEGKSYLRSQASNHKHGLRGYIADKVKANEEDNQMKFEESLELMTDRYINKSRNRSIIEGVLPTMDIEERYRELTPQIVKELNEMLKDNPYVNDEDIEGLAHKTSKKVLIEAMKDSTKPRKKALSKNEYFEGGKVKQYSKTSKVVKGVGAGLDTSKILSSSTKKTRKKRADTRGYSGTSVQGEKDKKTVRELRKVFEKS